jgi:hypothetical protein
VACQWQRFADGKILLQLGSITGRGEFVKLGCTSGPKIATLSRITIEIQRQLKALSKSAWARILRFVCLAVIVS